LVVQLRHAQINNNLSQPGGILTNQPVPQISDFVQRENDLNRFAAADAIFANQFDRILSGEMPCPQINSANHLPSKANPDVTFVEEFHRVLNGESPSENAIEMEWSDL